MGDGKEHATGDLDADLTLLFKEMGMGLNPPKENAESDMQKKN